MTAVTAATDVPVRGTHPSPVIRAARLQLVAWPQALLWPWGILALSFAVNLMIFGLVQDAQGSWTGGLMSIYVVMLVGHWQMFSSGVPFAMGMSVTRRAYYLGTWLVTVVEALLFSAVLFALRLVEDATDGWGMSLEYYGLGFSRESAVLEYLTYVVPFLLVAAVGACIGMVVLRWSTNGLMVLIAGVIVAVGAGIVILSRTDTWGAVGDWFGDQSAVSLFAGWPLPIAAVLALVGYAVIRRATI